MWEFAGPTRDPFALASLVRLALVVLLGLEILDDLCRQVVRATRISVMGHGTAGGAKREDEAVDRPQLPGAKV